MAVEPQPLPESSGLYFFLSHAHQDGPDRDGDPDYWVRMVFTDLTDEVKNQPRERIGWQIGMFRPCADVTVDLDDRVRRAIDNAGVFVALCSEPYLRDERALAQRSAFHGQRSALIADPPWVRVLPVLWEPPVEGVRSPDFDEAFAVLPEIPGYAEQGLLALVRLRSRHGLYRQVLALLGEWIVDVVDGRRPPPGRGRRAAPPPDPRSTTGPGRGGAPDAPGQTGRQAFVIAVLALSGAYLPGGPAGSVASTASWPSPPSWPSPQSSRYPPSGRLNPVADQVATCVDGDRFEPRLTGFHAGADHFARSPGLLLIDPWILDAEDGEALLRQALQNLPRWVVPVVAAGSVEAVHACDNELWGAVRTLAGTDRASRPRMGPEPQPSVASLRALVEEACGRYESSRPPARPRPFPKRGRIIDATSDAKES